jgi:hypothetical protein
MARPPGWLNRATAPWPSAEPASPELPARRVLWFVASTFQMVWSFMSDTKRLPEAS